MSSNPMRYNQPPEDYDGNNTDLLQFYKLNTGPEHQPDELHNHHNDYTDSLNPYKKAGHATYHKITEIIHDEKLIPEEKPLQMILAGVDTFYSTLNLPTDVITRAEAENTLKLAAKIMHLDTPTDIHQVTRELMLEELSRLTEPYEKATPLYYFDVLATKSMRSLHSNSARMAALALRIWILETSPNNDRMPSHYDRLRELSFNK